MKNLPGPRSENYLTLGVLLLAIGVIYLACSTTSEPFFNTDETRHVMTGVYFRDLIHDLPIRSIREYTVNYYLQYPALGLLVWPPLFYLFEGLAMSVFGTSMAVSNALILLFAAIGFAYFFLLVRFTHEGKTAVVAVLILALSPMVFELSHHVMLEIPTMALGLAATFHFVRYMDLARRRDLLLAALASSLAALTRFDAAYLLLFFLILLVVRGKLSMLWKRDVLITAALALVVVAPVYAMSAAGIGWMHFKFATQTLSPDVPGFLSWRRYIFYPSLLGSQLGWIALVPAVIGLGAVLTASGRKTSWLYLSLIAATYLTFTPLGELESRHTIYWLPALSFFAATGVRFITDKLSAQTLFLPAAALLVFVMGWSTLAKPQTYVRGYDEAARYVLENTRSSPYCLFVGKLNGDFIYQLRLRDPSRKLWVLRADKLLFSVLMAPEGEHRELAVDDSKSLATIYKYDPEFIILELPRTLDRSSPAESLRTTQEEQARTIVRSNPDRFRLEKEIAVDSNDFQVQGARLEIYRNVFRNPEPEHHLELEILMLRQSLETDLH
jgi:hypothetical protein